MKRHLTTILLVVMLIAGLALVMYPTISNYLNSRQQTRAILEYSASVDEMAQGEFGQQWADAREYNASLLENTQRYFMTNEQRSAYQALLNVAEDGLMGYLEIPAIESKLAIYHGTEEAVLQTAVGHIEGSSLPVGGLGTHCAVSGHRGLPSAKLFTNLDQLQLGDTFMLHVLDATLTYEVDQILVVLPDDVEALEIDPEQDYCTLVTCTPYGINSHRLLVRGHRVETPVNE